MDLARLNKLKDLNELLVLQYDYIFNYIGKAPDKKHESDQVDNVGDVLFLTYDMNGDGVMDRSEFEIFYNEIMVTLGIDSQKQNIDNVFKMLDGDNKGNIEKKRFSDWWKYSFGNVKLPQ